MDIKGKVSLEQKQEMQNLLIEAQVLENLLRERKARIQEKAEGVIILAGLDPKVYGLEFNPGRDVWEAKLKVGAIVVPNRVMNRKN